MNTFKSNVYDYEAVLINPPYDGIDDDALEENLGLSYIAGYLQDKGVTVAIHEMTGRLPLAEKLKFLHTAKVYGISLYSTAIKSAKTIIDYIRKHMPSSLIYIGGPHPSALPEQTLLEFAVDGVVTGEGEHIFYSIITAANAGTPLRGVLKGIPIPELDCIPFPARSLVDRSHFTRRFYDDKCISIITSRGCPYNCLHCNSTIMGGKSKIRYRSIENIINEIRYVKELGYNNIRFNDDNFTANPHLHELLSAIAYEHVSYRAFGRVENFTPTTCELLINSGCKMLSAGIESCNPDNLRFLGKQGMLPHFKNFRVAKEYGIAIRASFMVGLPFDTDKNIEYYFSEDVLPEFDEFAVYALIPYPGTEIFASPAKYNYTIENHIYSEYKQLGKGGESCFVLSYNDGINSFTPDDVRRWHKRANELLGKTHKNMKYSAISR